ncbi:hypothetical protein [Collinsella tanakaei]|uniref:hypothetical protein n=1 Tax=Collinsella tanakaei TaxID=626935 RepID=UPI0022E39942|nr:hypothetical protein [Collinsella tanakaei]
MKKTDCTTVKLSTGAVSVYDFGTAKLHAYQTNDPLADEVFAVEKDGKGVVLEYPPFVANIEELGGYIVEQGIEIEGIVAAYHMAGASFLPGTPVFATKGADEYGHTGGGKALIDGFATAFGASFDASVPGAVTYIEGDELELAGVKMGIVRNDDAFDIEIPELNAVYTHMLGHDCHSIVAGAGHADAIIAQLKGYQAKDNDLVLTSHYTPEDLKDVQAKIDYLEDLKRIAAQFADAAAFKAAVQERYPEYAGENYLDMTCGFFFGA